MFEHFFKSCLCYNDSNVSQPDPFAMDLDGISTNFDLVGEHLAHCSTVRNASQIKTCILPAVKDSVNWTALAKTRLAEWGLLEVQPSQPMAV